MANYVVLYKRILLDVILVVLDGVDVVEDGFQTTDPCSSDMMITSYQIEGLATANDRETASFIEYQRFGSFVPLMATGIVKNSRFPTLPDVDDVEEVDVAFAVEQLVARFVTQTKLSAIKPISSLEPIILGAFAAQFP